MRREGKGGAKSVEVDESEFSEIVSSKIGGFDWLRTWERSIEFHEFASRSP